MESITHLWGASATPAHEPRLVSSELTVRNRHAGVEIRSFAPGSDLRTAAETKGLFDRRHAISDGRRCLDGVRDTELFERHGMLVVARRGSETLGSLRFREIERGQLVVQGIAVWQRRSGMKLVSAMGAHGILHSRVVFGDAEHIHISFARFGFGQDVSRNVIAGPDRDHHQHGGTEIGGDRAIVRHRWMTLGPEAYPMARRFLAQWSEAVFPEALLSRRD